MLNLRKKRDIIAVSADQSRAAILFFWRKEANRMAKSKMLKIEQQTEKKPYILLYARVSTDRQAEEGYSIEIQKERLAAYVKSLYGTDEAQTELFVDDGYSGGNLERPAMQRMIQSIKEGNGTHVSFIS